MAFFDIDEFLYLKNKRDIKDWLSEFQDERVIYVFWRLFGDNGLKEVKDNNYSVLDRFKKCDDKLFPLGKPIINTKKNNRELLFFNPHIVIQTLPQDVKEENLINLSLPNKKKCKRPWLLTEEEMKKYSDQPIELWHFRNKTYQENYERKFKQDDAYHDSEKCDFHQDLDVFNKEFEKYNRNIIDVSEI